MRPHPFSLLFVAPLLFACRAIPETDPRWERQELEVSVEVDPLISDLLQEAGDAPALESVVSQAVLGLADVGLRFYAVPSETYAEGEERPAYHLTVHVQDVRAYPSSVTSHAASEAPGEPGLDRICCTAVATLMKRRGNGPPLMVGKSTGTGQARAQEASASLSTMREFELRSTDPYRPPTRLRSDELTASIQEAVVGALRALVAPIDREFGDREFGAADSALPASQ
jgi:hypothetical protein